VSLKYDLGKYFCYIATATVMQIQQLF